MMQVVVERTGQQLALPLPPLSDRGASGIVYRHPGNPKFCVKIYRDTQLAKKHELKVRSMLANPPDDVIVNISGSDIAQLAWPTDVVLQHGQFAGFIMPFIDMSRTVSIDSLIRPVLRKGKNLPEHLAFRLRIAVNIAKMLRSIHLKGHRMIDVKPANISVYAWNPSNPQPGAGCIALLDCDGFQISSSAGQSLRGEFASDDYILPSALRKTGGFDGTHLNTNGIEQDTFAFAVIAFQLLNNGFWPITAEPDPRSSIQLPATNLESWITLRKDTYAFTRKPNGKVRAPENSLHPWMSDRLLEYFETAFLSPDTPPPLKDWIAELERLSDPKQKCRKDPTHWKLGDGKCGQCELANRGSQTPMPSMPSPSVPRRPPPRPVNSAPVGGVARFIEKDLNPAIRSAVLRGFFTGTTVGGSIVASNILNVEGAAPYIYGLGLVLLFWTSATAFAAAPTVSVSKPTSFLEKLKAWILGLGGHGILAALMVGAVVFLSPYLLSVADSVVSASDEGRAYEEARVADQYAFEVAPYFPVQTIVSKYSGSNIREKPFAAADIKIIRETVAGEILEVIGVANQLDGEWYEIRLPDGREVYIKASLTEVVPVDTAQDALISAPEPWVGYEPVSESGIQQLPLESTRNVGAGPIDEETAEQPVHLASTLPAQASGPLPIVRLSEQISGKPPKYPQKALTQGIEGYARVKFTVLASGRTSNIRLIAESPSGAGFGDSTIRAVRGWKYSPKTVDGRAVSEEVSLEVPFEIAGN